MLKIFADRYIELGMWIADARITFDMDKYFSVGQDGKRTLNEKGHRTLQDDLRGLLEVCNNLSLPISKSLVNKRMADPPETSREYDLLVDAVMEELKSQLFLFVPLHRAMYYDLILPSIMTTAFPTAASELVLAGNCIAAGLYTASVFHSMRAVEIGLRAMAASLGVTLPYPLELAEWGKIVGEIEPKINALKLGERSTQKDEDLAFYSEAASQFRHFNNGWRIRVSHGRKNYEEPQALSVIGHAMSFFQTLATRLKE